MKYRLDLRPSARKDLEDLPQEARDRVAAGVRTLIQDPRGPNSKALHGKFAGRHRLRVGNYRVMYIVDDEAHVVDVIRIGPRENFYVR